MANINGVFGKNFQTTGLEKVEADGLARLLRSGSLAAPMDFIEERIVGPSLGAENVSRGITAVGFAFLFTLVFFMIYYRNFGLVTSVAGTTAPIVTMTLLAKYRMKSFSSTSW